VRFWTPVWAMDKRRGAERRDREGALLMVKEDVVEYYDLIWA